MANRTAILESTDYEPYENRVRAGQTNRLETLVNLVKGILGTGILAMPEAYKNSGFIVGTVGVVLITAAITYCLHLLFHAMYYFCKRDKISQITYPQAFKEGLKMGPNWLRGASDVAPFQWLASTVGQLSIQFLWYRANKYVVNFFIITYQLGVMCIYLVFCATNIKQVVDIHTSEENHLSTELYMVIMLVPLLMVCYIKNLKYLAPFSNVANWVTLAGLLCIYYFLYEKVEPLSDRKIIFAHIKLFPLFMGTTMFSVLSIGAILSIELNMKEGKYWGGLYGVLNQGMFIVTILNVFTGFSGYWKYGEQTESSITLNINIHHPLAQAVRILFCLAIYISYALQAYPATEILWDQYIMDYMETTQHKLVWDYVLRTITVFFSFLLAVAIPRLGLFISLFGAFCLSVLGIIFPPLLDICTRWPDDLGKGKLILVRDILLMIFGIAGWCFGTYTAIREIVISFTTS